MSKVQEVTLFRRNKIGPKHSILNVFSVTIVPGNISLLGQFATRSQSSVNIQIFDYQRHLLIGTIDSQSHLAPRPFESFDLVNHFVVKTFCWAHRRCHTVKDTNIATSNNVTTYQGCCDTLKVRQHFSLRSQYRVLKQLFSAMRQFPTFKSCQIVATVVAWGPSSEHTMSGN